MKIRIQHIVFVMWLVGISWHFAYFLYNAEHFAKMHIHDFDSGANLLFAFVTAEDSDGMLTKQKTEKLDASNTEIELNLGP